MSSLVSQAVERIIDMEQDRDRKGVAVVLQTRQFDRITFIHRLIGYFLKGGHNKRTEDPPTVLACSRQATAVDELMHTLNNRANRKPQGQLLRTNIAPRDIGAVAHGTYSALQQTSRLDTDAFDFVIVNMLKPNECHRFRELFARLEPAFLVVIMTNAMHEQGELAHWPQCGEPLFVAQRPRPVAPPTPSES